jgi:ABC-type amino acid transport substrate-binding protein
MVHGASHSDLLGAAPQRLLLPPLAAGPGRLAGAAVALVEAVVEAVALVEEGLPAARQPELRAGRAGVELRGVRRRQRAAQLLQSGEELQTPCGLAVVVLLPGPHLVHGAWSMVHSAMYQPPSRGP